MKKYLAARKRVSAIMMAGALGTFTFVAPQMADAQNAPEKIQLMAETLRARDSGDLTLAKTKAEELIKIAPNDQNVQRLLVSINNDIDRQAGGTAVFGQAGTTSVDEVLLVESAGTGATSAANALVVAAVADQDAKIAAAEQAIVDAAQLAELGAYADATGLLNTASSSLTLNTSTAAVIDDLDAAKLDVVLTEAKALAAAGNPKGAEAVLEQYRADGGNSKESKVLANQLNKEISNPYDLSIQEISPDYVEQTKVVRDLLTRARAQYLNGDYDGASSTFKEVEARDANNAEAKLFQTRIAEILGDIHQQNQIKTREQMLTEVDQSWERPKVFDIDKSTVTKAEDTSGILQKMKSIVIPQVNFSGMELTRVIETLSELSVEYDPAGVGVNIVPLFDANKSNPRVNISLRNLNLDRILEFVTQQVNFAYSVGSDAVTVDASDANGGESSNLTQFFPISRATVIRLTGFKTGGGGGSSDPVDPFAAPTGGGASGPSAGEEVEALQAFFQSAGVNFDVPGASLAFDGEQLIVTQTSRNLERMRVILRNYNDVKMVEIEAKFLEVTQGDIDEMGFSWNVTSGGDTVFDFQPRSVSDAFGVDSGSSEITITTTSGGEQTFPFSPPSLPTTVDLAGDGLSVADVTKTFGMGAYDANFAMTALSRKSGSDLMSAPKLTVLNRKTATITVAQEMLYPTSYGDIESEVGESSSDDSGSGAGAISITAGTPQDFEKRNVGVELTVTPNVETDDMISLQLTPSVTEFEGFVEYGGPSVAISGETTVTVPAGFYQPIFSTREVTTEVTVFDGATIVIGGLTRDEVKTMNDKVPVLGDVPGLGRLFRSEGETRLKRNLLIFVTANLVSPGGSPAKQNYRNVKANSLFQNPTIMTPSGSVNRTIDAVAE
jgi:general secretion pathway protein D